MTRLDSHGILQVVKVPGTCILLISIDRNTTGMLAASDSRMSLINFDCAIGWQFQQHESFPAEFGEALGPLPCRHVTGRLVTGDRFRLSRSARCFFF